MVTSRFLAPLLIILAGHAGAVWAQGSMFVTGHNVDDSHLARPAAEEPVVEQFFTVGLDFLVFGKKASPEQVDRRAAIRIAYLDPMDPAVIGGRHQFDFVSGYSNPTLFSLFNETWKQALVPGAFDVVIVGCLKYGGIPPGSVQALTLMSAKSAFEGYLNRGGKLFAIIQYQEANFLPKFGSTGGINTNYPTNVRMTTEGRKIGMDTSFFSGTMRHYQAFRLDDTLFKVFERSDLDIQARASLPVTFGFNGRIQDSIFIPDTVNTVQQPVGDIPSGLFVDSVCVEFSTLTDSATLSYSLNGTPPATSPLSMENHGRLCFRETTIIRLIGKKTGWKSSTEVSFTYTRKAQPLPSTLSLFSAGTELTQVTAGDSQLEVRLVRPSGGPCSGCTVNVTPSGGADAESLPLAAQGSYFRASFLRAESLVPVAGDGTLQHKASDSVVLIWINPQDAKDMVRRAYPYRPKPPVIPLAPALSLFYRGQEITVVDASQRDLDIRLNLDSTEACLSCPVLVFPSTGSDTETVLLTGGISPYQGTFKRELNPGAVRGDGTIQHDRKDSLVLLYRDPLDPAKVVRRGYPFLPARDTVVIRPQNTIAHTAAGQSIAPGFQWIISDAPGLLIGRQAGNGSCCTFAPTPVNAQNPDSLRSVGIVIEASHGFSLDLKVFSTLGEAVNRVVLTVPESEFSKLTEVAGGETRYMRVLWNGRARDESPAGNGVYIFKSTVTLLPAPGIATVSVTTTSSRRIGILRSPE